jgi:hypothetical protein
MFFSFAGGEGEVQSAQGCAGLFSRDVGVGWGFVCGARCSPESSAIFCIQEGLEPAVGRNDVVQHGVRSLSTG